MDEANGKNGSSASPLKVIEAHLDDLMVALKCPACGKPFGSNPYKSASCGHTLCFDCGELVLNKLGRCPVMSPLCDLHIIPKDLKPDRQVRDLVNATLKFRASLSATLPPNAHNNTNDKQTTTSNHNKKDNVGATVDTSGPILRKRVCVTAIEDAKSKRRIFRALRGLDADIQPFFEDQVTTTTTTSTTGTTAVNNIPQVVVTPLDSTTREFLSRSRSIHYALAYNLPIVDVSWVSASYTRREWLPTRPYECSLPHRPRPRIFDGCVFDIDIACHDASPVLADDLRRWLEAAGASLSFDTNNSNSNTCRLYARIVPDLAKSFNHHDNNSNIIWSDVELQHCEKFNITPQLQDIPWISDCLISQACPPRASVLETMAETMPDTFRDSEWMEDYDQE